MSLSPETCLCYLIFSAFFRKFKILLDKLVMDESIPWSLLGNEPENKSKRDTKTQKCHFNPELFNMLILCR